MSDLINLSLDQVHELALRALTHHGMAEDHARAIADVITQGQRDECHSHGLYRELVCVRSLRTVKVDLAAQPTLTQPSPSIVTVNAHRAYSLLAGAMQTFGGHKGSVLAVMIELLAGELIGDMTSAESLAFDANVGATPCHGEWLLAFDPKRFLGDDFEHGQQRAEQLFSAITDQGARLPSHRRSAARQRSQLDGVWVGRGLVTDIERLFA